MMWVSLSFIFVDTADTDLEPRAKASGGLSNLRDYWFGRFASFQCINEDREY